MRHCGSSRASRKAPFICAVPRRRERRLGLADMPGNVRYDDAQQGNAVPIAARPRYSGPTRPISECAAKMWRRLGSAGAALSGQSRAYFLDQGTIYADVELSRG